MNSEEDAKVKRKTFENFVMDIITYSLLFAVGYYVVSYFNLIP